MGITRRIITIATTALVLSAPVYAEEEPSKETVIATINGTDITLGHVISLASRLPEQYLDIENKDLYAGIVEQLIQQQLLGSLITKETTVIKLATDNEKRALLATEAIDRISVEALTQEAIDEQYNTAYKNEEPIPEYHAGHILVETEAEAQRIAEMLAGDADFAETAKQMSTGPSGSSGGDLGWTGLGQLVPEFEATMIALEAGQVSVPVKTDFGWHVIKLNEKRNQPEPELATVLEEIKQTLTSAAIDKRISQLKESVNIVRNEQEIDPSFVKKFEILKD
jgi:peptidyl-prolyl cis-trans isomerase C